MGGGRVQRAPMLQQPLLHRHCTCARLCRTKINSMQAQDSSLSMAESRAGVLPDHCQEQLP